MMIIKNRGVPKRIDIELERIIKELAKKNEINFRQASKELAKSFENQFKGKTILVKEIKF